MYGIYGDIISAAEGALAGFDEARELLEYPEVQADKAYYLSVLAKFNSLSLIKEKRDALSRALTGGREVSALLPSAGTEEERAEIYAEISRLKREAGAAAKELSDALGLKHERERALCRFRFTRDAAKIGEALYALVKAYLPANGIEISAEQYEYFKGGGVNTVTFTAFGCDVFARLDPLTGAHRVYFAGAKSGEICFAATYAESAFTLSEGDVKCDVFHSHGAGGQNINKVETAVRLTHIPTGISVTCQDERSQLKNKRRAFETLERRIKAQLAVSEKQRIEADISARHRIKNTPISFDATRRTMTDTRLSAFCGVPFPLTDRQFSEYLNGLIAL